MLATKGQDILRVEQKIDTLMEMVQRRLISEELEKEAKHWIYGNGYEFYEISPYSEMFKPIFTKEEDHLNLYCASPTSPVYLIVGTEEIVDVTYFSNIVIDWENVGTGTAGNSSMLRVLRESVLASTVKTGAFTRTQTSMDVSNILGKVRVQVYAKDTYSASEQECSINVYGIWGVKGL